MDFKSLYERPPSRPPSPAMKYVPKVPFPDPLLIPIIEFSEVIIELTPHQIVCRSAKMQDCRYGFDPAGSNQFVKQLNSFVSSLKDTLLRKHERAGLTFILNLPTLRFSPLQFHFAESKLLRDCRPFTRACRASGDGHGNISAFRRSSSAAAFEES